MNIFKMFKAKNEYFILKDFLYLKLQFLIWYRTINHSARNMNKVLTFFILTLLKKNTFNVNPFFF
jgi:hypothetical protein